MKNFFRTISGKVIVFFLGVISGCLLIGCSIAAVVLEVEKGHFNGGIAKSIMDLINSLGYVVIYGIGIASIVIFALCIIVLICVAGRRPINVSIANGEESINEKKDDEVFLGPLGKIPFDLLLAFCVVMEIIVLSIVLSIMNYAEYYFEMAVLAAACMFTVSMILGLLMSIAGRVKHHSFLKNNVIYWVLHLCWKIICFICRVLRGLGNFLLRIIRSIPIMWKSAIILFAVAILEFAVLAGTGGELDVCMPLFVIEKIIVILLILYFVSCLKTLLKGGESLAAGNLDYVINTKGMHLEVKKHAQNLNSIADTMSAAIEEKLKSERMKTELITNVSHDIKTPLTSIINYSSLIVSEPCDNEKIKEYSQVLLRQSGKLKRLIEDLVEASKASTGNLEVNLQRCDIGIFFAQISGEYEERLKDADLSLVLKQPATDIFIMADSRRMWRVFDNLLNNICKYSLKESHVYLTLEQVGKEAVISFKNTSAAPLDMSEEELMERFTRGDASRNTEGNGLGLSIARSLAELQSGTLKVCMDGDLFKAVLKFPVIE